MSFRFRRSIKIIPGVRLNVGKRGLSVSAGVRGARVTVGSSGTRVTAGIPGTGLSYTSKLDVRQSGSRYYDRNTGLSLTRSQVNAEIRRQHKEMQINDANASIRREQDQYEHFTKIASFSPERTSASEWQQGLLTREFSPQLYGIEVIDLQTTKNENLRDVWGKFLKGRYTYGFGIGAALFFMVMNSYSWNPPRNGLIASTLYLLIASASCYFGYKWLIRSRKEAIEVAQTKYSQFLKLLEDAKSSHPEKEAERIHSLNQLIAGDAVLVENQLQEEFENVAEEFSELDHSFKTEIGFQFEGPNRVFLDVDLPEIEDVIKTETKTVLKSGKISEKVKNKKTQNEEYVQGVVGLAFYLASRAFDVTPAIVEVVVSGYTQRVNKKTGNVQDDYVYSVRFDREKFSKLNLKSIDPIESITQFDVKIELTKTSELSSVEPFKEIERKAG